MDVLIYLANYSTTLIDTVAVFLFAGCYLQKRPWAEKATRYIPVLMLITLVSIHAFDLRTILSEHFDNQAFIGLTNISISFLKCYIIADLLYSGKQRIKLLLTAIFLVFQGFMDLGLYVITTTATDVDILYSQDGIVRYLGSCFLSLLMLGIVLTLRRYRKNSVGFFDGGAILLLQSSVPLLSILFVLVYLTIEMGRSDGVGMLSLGLLIAALTVINVIQYIVIERHQRLARENYDNMLSAQEYRHREEYYRQIEAHQQEIRTIKHDLKNQLITISAYMESSEKASDQLNLIINDVLAGDEVSFTRHVGVNALINAKRNIAKGAGITCNFEVKVPETMNFDEKDLGSILGNVLDNAIEACQRSQAEKEISLKLIYHDHALLLRCENTTDGRVHDLSTRKKNKLEHGLGTASIQAIVEKYSGDMAYAIVGDRFQTDITLWETKV